MIYLASDHDGFKLKATLKTHLTAQTINFIDVGPYALNPNDDYPDFAFLALEKVLEAPEENIAILLCDNGVGVSLLANKFKAIRCVLAFAPEQVKSSRADDDTNVLALPAGYIPESLGLELVDIWLTTPFSNLERHNRRLKKISNYDYSRYS